MSAKQKSLAQALFEIVQNKTSLNEKQIEDKLEALLRHPSFIITTSVILHASSSIKLVRRILLNRIWNALELPNKEQQERTLAILNQLEFRLKKVEIEKAELLKSKSTSSKKNVSHDELELVKKRAQSKDKPEEGFSAFAN
jgi:hypothetical protein